MSDGLFLTLDGPTTAPVTITPPGSPAACNYTPDSTLVTESAGTDVSSLTFDWGDGVIDVVDLGTVTWGASTTYDIGFVLNGFTGSPGDDNSHLHHTYTVDGEGITATVTFQRGSNDPIVSTVSFDVASGATDFTLESTIGHYAVYNHVLDSDAVERHWLAGHTAWSGDTDGERLNRILDYVAWPSGLRNIATGEASLSGEDWDDESPILQELQETETNGGGTLFVAADGRVTYLDRLFRVGASLDATFDIDGATAPEVPLEWSTDPTHLVNIIKATRAVTGGVTTTVLDQASIDAYGEYHDDSFSLKVTTDAEMIARARDKVQRYGEPDIRISQLVLKCSAGSSDDFWTAALALDIGSYVELTNLPGYAPASTLSYFVESVNDTVTIDGSVPEIVFSYDLSPGAIWVDWTDPTSVEGEDGGDAPGTVTVSSSLHPATTEIDVLWDDPDDGAQPDTFQVWLYASDGTTLADGPHTVTRDPSGTSEYDFTSLSTDTAFKFKVEAIRAGIPGPLAEFDVVTEDPPAAPDAPVYDAGSSGFNEDSINIAFDAPSGGSLVLSYTVSLYASDGTTLLDGPISIPTGSDPITHLFEGLTDATDYIVRFASVGEGGTTYAADAPFETGAAPSEPLDIAVTPTSDGGVITWSAPAFLGTGSLVLVGYEVVLWLTSDVFETALIDDATINDSTFTFTATGLDPSTGYTFIVLSRTAISGAGSSSTPTDFTTTA